MAILNLSFKPRKFALPLSLGATLLAICVFISRSFAADAKPAWQAQWEKTVGAAEIEGQVTVYGPPSIAYQNAIGAFQESFPKIKLDYVAGSGTDNSQRLVTERRAGKYLADLFLGGSGSILEVLIDGNLLEPMPAMLMLPEVRDPTLWHGKRHIYVDAKGQYVFMMQGNVNTSLATFNTKMARPEGIKSHWDLLNPRWKGKMGVYDQCARGHIQSLRMIYYSPKLGGEFLRRLFGEMDVTVSRDQRSMIDWVAQGKYLLSIFSSANDVVDAKKKGLPIDMIDAPDDESYMSGGFGHVGVLNRAPHPAATKVMLNWLLSRQGQLKWQDKTDNNSLRLDIPKNMLSDPTAIPQEKGQYVNTSLPQYQDVDAALKIVDDALAKAGKK